MVVSDNDNDNKTLPDEHIHTIRGANNEEGNIFIINQPF